MTRLELWAPEVLIEDDWPNGIPSGRALEWAIYMEVDSSDSGSRPRLGPGDGGGDGPARLRSVRWDEDVALYEMGNGLLVHVHLSWQRATDEDPADLVLWQPRKHLPLQVESPVLYPALTHENEIVRYRLRVESCEKETSTSAYRLVCSVLAPHPVAQ